MGGFSTYKYNENFNTSHWLFLKHKWQCHQNFCHTVGGASPCAVVNDLMLFFFFSDLPYVFPSDTVSRYCKCVESKDTSVRAVSLRGGAAARCKRRRRRLQ